MSSDTLGLEETLKRFNKQYELREKNLIPIKRQERCFICVNKEREIFTICEEHSKVFVDSHSFLSSS